MSNLELAYFNWINDNDWFHHRDRERIAKQLAAIACQFGASHE